MDAMFLYNEVPTQHMHTVKLAILEPPDDYSFAAEKRAIAQRLHCVPPFRWLMVPTPFGLNHPLAIEDPHFDLDLHLHRAAVPAPGGRDELCQFISELASRPLDRTRPLWEMWLVEGLSGGRIACVMKVHHTLADGVATADMLNRFLTRSPGEAPPPDDPPWRPEPVPTRRARLWLALRDLVPFLWKTVPALVRAVRETRRRRAAHADLPHGARPYEAPATSFNGILSSHRSFTFSSLPLSQFRTVKDALGGTLNDVVLAVVSGALRRYLEERGELPEASLEASVPVSTRAPEESGTWGNRVAAMYVSLRTDVADAKERLAAVAEAARASKREFADAEGAHLADVLELLPPPLAKLLFSRTTTLMKRLGRPSMANVIVSNVPGPRDTLYSNRSTLESFFSIGPVLEGIGLNVTAWSYREQLNFSLLADRRMVSDLWHLNDLLASSLEELVKIGEGCRDAAGGPTDG
jgi:WS/DGAT/MGAT family acyltransferase